MVDLRINYERVSFLPFFRAYNDDEANKKALDIINHYFENREEEYLRTFITFSVFRGLIPQDREYSEGSENLIPDILYVQEQWRKDEGKKAYAGATFGMSPEEVAGLSHFNGYKRKGTSMYCEKEKVGNKYYDVVLQFSNNALFNVSFLSQFYNTENFDLLMDYVVDFYTIIEKTYGSAQWLLSFDKYGKPDLTASFPKITDFDMEDVDIAHIRGVGNIRQWALSTDEDGSRRFDMLGWTIGDKQIIMYIRKVKDWYQMETKIFDTKAKTAYDEQKRIKQNKQKEEQIQEYSNMF